MTSPRLTAEMKACQLNQKLSQSGLPWMPIQQGRARNHQNKANYRSLHWQIRIPKSKTKDKDKIARLQRRTYSVVPNRACFHRWHAFLRKDCLFPPRGTILCQTANQVLSCAWRLICTSYLPSAWSENWSANMNSITPRNFPACLSLALRRFRGTILSLKGPRADSMSTQSKALRAQWLRSL